LEVLIDKIENRGTKSPIGDLVPETIYFGRTRTMKNVKMTIADCHPELACLAGPLRLSEASRRDSGSNNLIGKFVQAKIIKANTWNLEASLSLRAKRSNLIN